MVGGVIEQLDRAAVESLMDWWALSGVDQPVGEDAADWLQRKPAATVQAPNLPSPAPAPAERIEQPKDFRSFRDWIASAADLPMDRPGAVRILPQGVEQAPVMVLSDAPDRDDAAAARAIGGESFDLLCAMLRAIGIAPEEAYHASLSCFYAPGARIGRDELERCGTIARDHVRLAQPQRLILFGDAPARALTGEPLARARGKIHRIEGVRTIATFHPRWLLQRPSDKALAWRDLLLLMSDQD